MWWRFIVANNRSTYDGVREIDGDHDAHGDEDTGPESMRDRFERAHCHRDQDRQHPERDREVEELRAVPEG